MSTSGDPAICPLCGEANSCGAVAKSETCWCWNAAIPHDVIEKIPPAAKDKICICKNCATRAASAPQPLGLKPR